MTKIEFIEMLRDIHDRIVEVRDFDWSDFDQSIEDREADETEEDEDEVSDLRWLKESSDKWVRDMNEFQDMARDFIYKYEDAAEAEEYEDA